MFKLENPGERAGESDGKFTAHSLPYYLNSAAKSLAMLMAAGLALGFAGQALADRPGSPAANEIFAACSYDAAALDGILTIAPAHRNDLADAGDAVTSNYIVIYVLDTQNNGQELDGGGTTGPVVCVATPDTASASAESVPIPNEVDHPGGTTSVDILAIQGGSILQHRVNGGDRDSDIENRVCLSTDTEVGCVLVQKLLP